MMMSSCKKDEESTSDTKRMWIENITETTGIDPETDSVSAAVQWGIITEEDCRTLDEPLTNEYVAYTIYHLVGTLHEGNTTINDIENSPYRKEIIAVVSAGLMTVENHRFDPEQVTALKEQADVLERALLMMNNRFDSEDEFKIDFDEGITPEKIEPVDFDISSLEAVIMRDQYDLYPGDIVIIEEKNFPIMYRIDGINHEQSKSRCSLTPFDLTKDTNEATISGKTELDFSQCIFEESFNENTLPIQNMFTDVALLPLSKTFEVKGYKVTLSTTRSSLTASVSKKLKNNSTLSADIRIRNMQCNYQWLSDKEDIRNCYFKVNYESEESLNLKKSYEASLYGDFSDIRKEDLLTTLKSVFKPESECLQDTITLYTVEVPLPNNPMMSITLSLQLHLDINGNAKLSLVQTNEAGVEIRNGCVRIIKNNDSRGTVSVNANTEVSCGLNAGLSLSKQKLMDMSVDLGVDAGIVPMIHLFNDSGEMTSMSSDLPYDYIDEMSRQHDGITLCSDISAMMKMYLNLNSSSTVAGRLGFTRKVTMLTAKGPQFIQNLNGHYENGMKVPACTRKNKQVLPASDQLQISKRIRLKNYTISLDVNESEQIEILSLPQGYSESDLIFLTSHSKTVSVDSNGILHAHSAGGAVITVKTKDLKHYITCNVIVGD